MDSPDASAISKDFAVSGLEKLDLIQTRIQKAVPDGSRRRDKVRRSIGRPFYDPNELEPLWGAFNRDMIGIRYVAQGYCARKAMASQWNPV